MANASELERLLRNDIMFALAGMICEVSWGLATEAEIADRLFVSSDGKSATSSALILATRAAAPDPIVAAFALVNELWTATYDLLSTPTAISAVSAAAVLAFDLKGPGHVEGEAVQNTMRAAMREPFAPPAPASLEEHERLRARSDRVRARQTPQDLERLRVAVHEAGHAHVALCQGTPVHRLEMRI